MSWIQGGTTINGLLLGIGDVHVLTSVFLSWVLAPDYDVYDVHTTALFLNGKPKMKAGFYLHGKV
jgi:hypothetical protein